jgi:hypothetical protein
MGDDLADAVISAVAEGGREVSDEDLARAFEKAFAMTLEGFIGALSNRQSAHIARVLKDERAFQRRNQRRWAAAFNALEALWQICAEVGGEFNNHHRPEAVERDDYQFEALTALHARSLLVAREALSLMRQGFADGALARWRTLHELAAVAILIQRADRDVALRYLASFRFQALKAAVQIDQIIGKGTRESFSDNELADMRATCDALEHRFGGKLADDYEWARGALNIPLKTKVTFRHIEAEVGLTQYRPYYRWASQHNHGGHRPAHHGLGMVEATSIMLQIGPSNSGMVDPLQLVALTLAKSTAALLSSQTSLGIAIQLGVVNHFAKAVAPIALEVEEQTLREARRRSPRSDTTSRTQPNVNNRGYPPSAKTSP